MKKSFLFPVLAFLMIAAIASGFKKSPVFEDYWLDYIISKFEKYITLYHQNKVYLQTDKEVYETGETIYIKGYVVNNANKLPENEEKNLYLEMIAPDNSIFMRRILKIENGIAKGDFPILDTVYTGLYMLRAYTNNMNNSDKDYLFTKDISIIHPQKVYYNKNLHKVAKKTIRKNEEVDLQFFPEGGDMVDKLPGRIAFKAINQNGLGTDIEGKIFSGKGNFICDFKSQHIGMGQFELNPVYGQKYYAEITTSNKKKIKFNLPEVIQNGYAIRIDDEGNQFKVVLSSNKQFGNDPVAKTVYLIAQSGGKIYSSGKHLFEQNEIKLNIGKKNFPSGIVQFTLFDGQGNPQCERIVFVDHHDRINLKTNIGKNQYKKREKVEFDILVSDQDGDPIQADMGISVKQKSGFDKKNTNLLIYMLLQSDLKGYIEEPAYYFSDHLDAQKNLDVLMLTQGWRKFLWKDILADSLSNPKFPLETDIRITGRVTKYFLDISVKNANLTLTLLNQFNDVFRTKSGKKGYFEFTGLDYSDTIDVLIEVRTMYNKKNVMILVYEQTDIIPDFNPFRNFYLDSLRKRHRIEYKKWEPEPEDPSKPKDHKIHGEADQVIKFTDQMATSGQNVMDILRSRIPGLQVGSNGATMRGPSSFLLSNDPLFLIDGVPVDFNAVQTLSPYDVDYVEVLKGPSSAIYGLRGSNGVIAVYTKKGHYYKRGEIRFRMLGYHTPKKFYSPRYDKNEGNAEIPDERKTIFWSPSVKADKNGIAHVEFYHSDIPGDFEIVIEGMDESGKFGSFTGSYTVKD